jgi:hypothetical protein
LASRMVRGPGAAGSLRQTLNRTSSLSGCSRRTTASWTPPPRPGPRRGTGRPGPWRGPSVSASAPGGRWAAGPLGRRWAAAGPPGRWQGLAPSQDRAPLKRRPLTVAGSILGSTAGQQPRSLAFRPAGPVSRFRRKLAASLRLSATPRPITEPQWPGAAARVVVKRAMEPPWSHQGASGL